MNQLSPGLMAQNAQPTTKRALAKLRTRESLLASARRLFAERGYEAATVRDIAAGAQLSTGAVFASFSDKAQMFEEILDADARALSRTMYQVASLSDRRPRERLAAVLAAAYAFHLRQLPLLQATLSRGWRHSGEAEAFDRERQRPQRAVLEDILRDAVRSGELGSGLDIDLAADLVWQAYQSNYRFAAYDGFDLPALTQRLERQLDLIFSGIVEARAA